MSALLVGFGLFIIFMSKKDEKHHTYAGAALCAIGALMEIAK